MFLPTTLAELDQFGWKRLDVILVTGDSYIDSPYIGDAIIGKVLVQAGFRVGIIAQPDIHTGKDITRLGEPALFWGVSGGSVDSMVANYTPTKKRRKSDDFTPGGRNTDRPDRAVIVYSNLIRANFKKTAPIVLGGIEASLRRIAHYDYWNNRIRRSILFDAKGDFLLYGMAESSVVELAGKLKKSRDIREVRDICGLCYTSRSKPESFNELPSFERVSSDKQAFTEMFHLFYRSNDPVTGRGLVQKYDNRYLIQNPPPKALTQRELDQIHAISFERDVHPYYKARGAVKAIETIRFSIPTHRGCYGECNFCAIAVHQGRTVQWRSEDSILAEARTLSEYSDFKGYLLDVGGPTANMYGFECGKKVRKGSCMKKRCIYPGVCDKLPVNHHAMVKLLERLRSLNKIKKVFVASGIRYDLVLRDTHYGITYLREIVANHVSGQLKIAPEHSVDNVLQCMGKPVIDDLVRFHDLFYQFSLKARKKQYLTYYFIAAHPGCTQQDMEQLKRFASHQLKTNPEQVQIFTPTPATYSTLMYYTGVDPFSGKPIFVEKNMVKKEKQKNILTAKGKKGCR